MLPWSVPTPGLLPAALPTCCLRGQAETLVGVMSNKALDALINSSGKFNMSSNW